MEHSSKWWNQYLFTQSRSRISHAIDCSHKVDYFCGAPIVLSMILNLPKEKQTSFAHHVEVMVAGAAPCCHY